MSIRISGLIEKSLPTILSAGVIGLFTMTIQFWVLKSEVAGLRNDVNNMRISIQSLTDRSAYFHGVDPDAAPVIVLARKEKK